ncbi:MAG: hypothetical protein IT449_06340 [Phycisphaerales bacterium]|nr:hypothetical protein [Phycisphaerales bacterium]
MRTSLSGRLGTSALVLVCSGACSSSRFGEELLAPPRQSSEASSPTEFLLPASFPGSGGFNLFHAKSSEEGGASATAIVDRTGSARAEVTLHETGEGSAEFELGQIIPAAATSSSSSVVAAVKLDSAYELSANSMADPSPAGKLALKIVILDSQRRVVKRQTLTEVELGQAAPRGAGRFERTFEFTLEPTLSYQILVAGRVELGSPTTTTDAAGSLSVSRVEVALQAAADR